MSTHAIIAFGTLDNWRGVPVHFDGYPAGLGRSLITAYQGYFERDLARMEKFLIDDHPYGWLIARQDWNLPLMSFSDYYSPHRLEAFDGNVYGEDGDFCMPILTPDSKYVSAHPYMYVINPELTTISAVYNWHTLSKGADVLSTVSLETVVPFGLDAFWNTTDS